MLKLALSKTVVLASSILVLFTGASASAFPYSKRDMRLYVDYIDSALLVNKSEAANMLINKTNELANQLDSFIKTLETKGGVDYTTAEEAQQVKLINTFLQCVRYRLFIVGRGDDSAGRAFDGFKPKVCYED